MRLVSCCLSKLLYIPLVCQGDIGKFGRVDLSDVADFCVLADGKVVTTSESGFLLLWDGISIKTQVSQECRAFIKVLWAGSDSGR